MFKYMLTYQHESNLKYVYNIDLEFEQVHCTSGEVKAISRIKVVAVIDLFN